METMITEYEKKGIESFYRKEGIRIGEAKGRAEGEASKALQIAKNLKQSGVSPDIIVAATGLTLQQVQAL